MKRQNLRKEDSRQEEVMIDKVLTFALSTIVTRQLQNSGRCQWFFCKPKQPSQLSKADLLEIQNGKL